MQCRSKVSRLVIVIILLLLGWPHGTTIAASAANTPVVANSNAQFAPQNISINVGDQVTWTNDGGLSHNVVADDNSFRSGDPSTTINFTFTFNTPGVYRYYCELHGLPGGGGMSGTVTVVSAAVLTPRAYFPLAIK